MKALENSILVQHVNKVKQHLNDTKFFTRRKIKFENQDSFAFAIFTLQSYLKNYTIDELLPFITDGSDDQSIDIFHQQEDDDTLKVSIFQLKYRTQTNLNKPIGENDIILFKERLKQLILDGNTSNLPLNETLARQYDSFKDTLESYKGKIEIHLYLVTNGEKPGTDELLAIKRIKDEFGVNIAECLYCNDYDFFFGDENKSLGEISIPISFNSTISNNDEISAYVVNISAYHLAKLYEKFRDGILEKNVRKLLKSNTNNEIRESLIEHPKLFWHKNNGLSIVCKRAEVKTIMGTKNIILEDPYIVNGGQTTKTIYNVYKDKDQDNEQDMAPLYEASVLARIYQTTDEELIASIVYGTNNQNKVTALDLKMLNPNIRKIKKFFTGKGIYLVTHRDIEQKIFEPSVSLDHLLQMYWAIYGKEPHKAKNNKGKLVNEELDKVINDYDNSERLLNSYRIYKFVANKLSESDKNEDIIRHGVYALTYVISKLNEHDATELDENYAKSKYDLALKTLRKIIRQAKKENLDYAPHNFFKSQNSTDLINKTL